MFGQTNLGEWHQWVNTGALGAFAVFVCWVSYRIMTTGGQKVLELGERYVKSTESLHDTLRETEENREELCRRHADGIEAVTGAVSIGNTHLQKLVALHEDPGGDVHDAIDVIHAGHKDVQNIKRAALQACRMCREISARELPGSADEVAQHCDAIERIIQNME